MDATLYKLLKWMRASTRRNYKKKSWITGLRADFCVIFILFAVIFVSVCARWLSRTFPFGYSLVVLLLLNMIVSSSDERVYQNVGLLFVCLSCVFSRILVTAAS